jgi:prepilin-type N-terminal cleavage/methylation domain-containing protein
VRKKNCKLPVLAPSRAREERDHCKLQIGSMGGSICNSQFAICNLQSSSLLHGGARAAGRRSRLNGGFTLLELTLALAVLAVVIGLTWPALLRFVGEQDLKEDVAEVRARLASVRMLAIEEGIAYQFRYESQGQRFLILPYERPLGSGSSSGSTSSAASQIPASQAVQVFELGVDHLFLPEPRGPLGSPTPVVAERLSEEWLRLFGGDVSLAQGNWSPAILFMPDGTAQDASLVVVDEEGRYQSLSVRGLTGAVYVGPVEREDRR